ncbi:MAG: hypothetical protein JSS09_02395, partial [Verrucomicrobia bacterium]|nr:hypothetical protein [Verrucomicrobiota bacterium]
HYGLTSGVALWLSVIHFSVWAAESKGTPNIAENLNHSLDEYSLKHTVNFNNVSVTEVIRFISKITGSNFIFVEGDVNFNVTIVSEEPMSIKNITSALIQILRIRGLKLLEQDNNFVITKSASDVNQIPTIVSSDLPGSENTEAPIITKVFRIKNASLSTLINIIRPMVSGSSLIEMVPQTHQLIVTDIATNLEKISSLITLLDTPLSNLEIESYTIKNMSSDHVIPLAEKILKPFTGSNPLFLIPQKETNTIFIVSTPYLIEQTMSVLEDLDIPGKALIAGEASLSTYIYKIENQMPESLLSDLSLIQKQIPSGTDPNLEQAIANCTYIPSAGSIVFITDAHTWGRLKVLLSSLDTVPNPVG